MELHVFARGGELDGIYRQTVGYNINYGVYHIYIYIYKFLFIGHLAFEVGEKRFLKTSGQRLGTKTSEILRVLRGKGITCAPRIFQRN